jgi:hypothetical protein
MALTIYEFKDLWEFRISEFSWPGVCSTTLEIYIWAMAPVGEQRR